MEINQHDRERAENRKQLMKLTRKERFELLFGQPKTIMNETDTHPELCQQCKPLIESSKLEWVKVGGMSVGLHRQPLQWILRDKYSSDMIKQNAKYSQQLAAKSREIANIIKERDEARREAEYLNGTLFMFGLHKTLPWETLTK